MAALPVATPATPRSGGNPPPAAYFAALRGAFDRAAACAGGAIERTYLIGGCGLRLRFAGPTLLDALTAALAHRACPPEVLPQGATLDVALWDGASTGVVPPPGWSPADRLPRGAVRGYDDPAAPIRASYDDTSGAIGLLDAAGDAAVYCVPGAPASPERAAPLRPILHPWLAARGRQLVHAGAVGTPRGGALIVGRGGAGKSTTCLACLAAPESGLRYAADDYALLESGPALRIHSLYATAKLVADQAWRVPRLAPLVAAPDGLQDTKIVLQLARRAPERLIDTFPLRAVLVPRVAGGRESRLRPATPGAALAALAPSTIFQLAGAGGAALRALGDAVARVPCYHLDLGEETARLPPLIAALLDAEGG